MTAQRLRLSYARGPEARHLSQSEVLRHWEAALRLAGLPVGGETGSRRRPRLGAAPPLPRGATSDEELLDVYLDEPWPPSRVKEALQCRVGPGFRLIDVQEVGQHQPSLQAAVRWSEYLVVLPPDHGAAEVAAAVARFLSRETLPWEHVREAKTRRYDIRALVGDLQAEPAKAAGPQALRMRLRADGQGMGRPDQVVAALGLGEPTAVHRLRLILALDSPVRLAWRRTGRFRD